MVNSIPGLSPLGASSLLLSVTIKTPNVPSDIKSLNSPHVRDEWSKVTLLYPWKGSEEFLLLCADGSRERGI